MKVTEFDIEKGAYSFEHGNFNTEMHSHPAIEIIMATDGVFSVQTPFTEYSHVQLAMIEANVHHRVTVTDSLVKLYMVERSNSVFRSLLAQNGIRIFDGIFVEKSAENKLELFHQMHQNLQESNPALAYDERINRCLKLFKNECIEYNSMISTLQHEVHLSESRLSHLFKEQLGISLKKYLVWCRLRSTIHTVLKDRESLFSASIRCGFYDQAHMSRAFREMLGISPSKVYNSRTLQG